MSRTYTLSYSISDLSILFAYHQPSILYTKAWQSLKLSPSLTQPSFPVQSTGEMIVSSSKYHVQENSHSMYETRMSMIVRKFQKDDVGSYRCIAKNSLGEVDSSIRLYGKLAGRRAVGRDRGAVGGVGGVFNGQ